MGAEMWSKPGRVVN
jgi:hypothetical protein